MTNKLYITMEGGLISCVHSTIDNLEVFIIDHDINEDDDPDPDEVEEYKERQAAFAADFEAGRLATNY